MRTAMTRDAALFAAKSRRGLAAGALAAALLLVGAPGTLRAQEATPLGPPPLDQAREALRDAMLDRSIIVQEAAEASLMRISHSLAQDRPEDDESQSQPIPQNTHQEVLS